MSKLIMLKGLPASGKSTYAKQLVDKLGYKRLNKDDLRLMIDNNKWSKKNEDLIKTSEAALALIYVTSGYNIVIDDTNFAYENFWSDFAKRYNLDFEVIFFDTPINECIKRDALRGDKSIGADPIYKMYRKYCEPKKVPYNKNLRDAYIFDIDGTLALMKDRGPFDWDKVSEDSLNEHVALILDALNKQDVDILIVSGRDGVSQFDTEAWLDFHGIKYNKIFMRPARDSRKDAEIKKEIYENNIKDKYNILGVFDDRDQVVDLWRSLGLTCFQVNYGSF